MYWEEKIDILQRKYSQQEFRVPFTYWADIFEQIESRFIKNTRPSYHFTNWSENFKQSTHLRFVPNSEIGREIVRLNDGTNYWVIVVFGQDPTSKHYVYDCSINAMRTLLSMAPSDFYICSKKYEWLTFFRSKPALHGFEMNRVGEGKNPFE